MRLDQQRRTPCRRDGGGTAGIALEIDDSVRRLPHFDPDLEAAAPESVLRFRAQCDAAGGVLLSVPEYAFGIPGAFKNALDWTVGSTCLYRKPVTVLDVAPLGRGEAVRTALGLVLKALDADVVFRSVPVTGDDRDAGWRDRPPEDRRGAARDRRRARRRAAASADTQVSLSPR